MSLLTVDNLEVAYGSIAALRGVSIEVNPGEVVALVGTNGAGKTTLLSTIAGILKPIKGSIHFQNESINNLSPENIVRKGIALVPEGRRIFPTLSVWENLRLGAISRRDSAAIESDLAQMCQQFRILGERINQPGGTLSGGEQQQLAIARALMSRPVLLMLDEPSLGLAPILVEEIFQMVGGLRETGVTILIVEQNVKRTLQLANRAYLINTGKIEASGTSQDILEQVDIESTLLGDHT